MLVSNHILLTSCHSYTLLEQILYIIIRICGFVHLLKESVVVLASEVFLLHIILFKYTGH